MRLELGSRVGCTDGEAGELADVVVDPLERTATHLVVRPRGQAERLVPIELAGTAGGRDLALGCSRAELAGYPSPEAVAFLSVGDFPEGGEKWDVGVEDEVPLPSPAALELGDLAGSDATEVEVVYDRVPEGTIELRRASLVESTDGEVVGTVHALVLDGVRITQLVVTSGHLWWRREHGIPVDAIDRLRTDLVTTRLSGGDVAALPPPRS